MVPSYSAARNRDRPASLAFFAHCCAFCIAVVCSEVAFTIATPPEKVTGRSPIRRWSSGCCSREFSVPQACTSVNPGRQSRNSSPPHRTTKPFGEMLSSTRQRVNDGHLGVKLNEDSLHKQASSAFGSL